MNTTITAEISVMHYHAITNRVFKNFPNNARLHDNVTLGVIILGGLWELGIMGNLLD